jgi:hypothetical protein
VQLIESNDSYKPHFQKPTDEVIDGLIEQCQGDIRNAILNLNFAAQKSDFKISLPKAVKAKKGGKKQKTDLKAADDGGLGKNEVLSTMHGLGRVFYPKLELDPKTNIMKLTHNPETLTEIFSSQPSKFINMVHANYVKNFSEMNEVSEVTDMFSISDCLDAEYRDERISLLNLNIIIRAAMVLNKTPSSGFRKISAYGSKKWKKTEEANKEKFMRNSVKLNNGNMLMKNDFFCDYNNFINIIRQ